MNQFQVSPAKRLASRVYFYTTIMAGSYLIGNMVPSSTDIQEDRDRLLGVAKAYCGVPISEVPEKYRQ